MSLDHSRRRLLQKLAVGVPLLPLAAYQLKNAAVAADAPFLSPDAKEAQAVKYVEDASKAKGAVPGSTCANCAVYQGHSGAPAGACQIFPGMQVKGAGRRSSCGSQ